MPFYPANANQVIPTLGVEIEYQVLDARSMDLSSDTSALLEEGAAPPDTLPRIIAGVVRRSELSVGDPREVSIEGEAEAFDALMEEFEPALLEEEVAP